MRRAILWFTSITGGLVFYVAAEAMDLSSALVLLVSFVGAIIGSLVGVGLTQRR